MKFFKMLNKILLLLITLVFQQFSNYAPVIAADDGKSVPVRTILQENIRPSYPFPNFLSTGPYVWYDDVKNQPIKGHTYRISKFSDSDNANRIYIEKVNFGIDGCCLEIVEYRQLLLNEELFQQHFPNNSSNHGFKLTRWVSSEAFQFNAYGGNYILSKLGDDQPLLAEVRK